VLGHNNIEAFDGQLPDVPNGIWIAQPSPQTTHQWGANMMAVLFILAGYAIVPVLVVSMKSNSLQEGGRSRFPAVQIITS
jgi:hypothetical protein